MNPLALELKTKKTSLLEFLITTKNVLQFLQFMTTDTAYVGDYRISKQKNDGTEKFLRPINTKLYISDPENFQISFEKLIEILGRIKSRILDFSDEDLSIIDSVVYTIQQSIGAGFDLLVASNSSRKHVGNRFEELIRCVFSEIGIENKHTVLQIPYETESGKKVYKCENDLVISPYSKVRSTGSTLDEKEIVVSVKTTSKDRMGKMFIDKMLLERFVKHPQKVIGIFLNDVQRKEEKAISYTLVSGLFMVYTQFLTPLEGIYYLDPPPNALKKPFSNHMSTFSRLITKDVFKLLAS
ncbi:hypothetical protein [Algoriphagus aquimarinus]|uniref:Uncharacterized protein n=1 Tax=Algoriphagus aquimarinus TaxID=237018 RepID=A0A5C7B2U9_9BACT|nr:hypothetical protein [Algoriphagus aquimarinus]TXE14757.1 hypothetical protein ESV85_04105 [Algoriphagus aquimarinus]